MSDDFKEILENNIKSYAAAIRTHISWMGRDLEGVEIMGNKLQEYQSWGDFMDVLNYLDDLQVECLRCKELIHRGLEDNDFLRQYKERMENDE